MKLNTLLLTSAATLMATSVAFAADLPSKKAAPAAGSVQVCKVGGMTGYTIPGSDVCLDIGGFVRYTGIYSNYQYDTDARRDWTNIPGDDLPADADGINDWSQGGGARVHFDARSNSEIGVVRSFVQWDGGMRRAYVQFSGVTAGIKESIADIVSSDSEFPGSGFGSATTGIDYQVTTGGLTFGIGAEQGVGVNRNGDYDDDNDAVALSDESGDRPDLIAHISGTAGGVGFAVAAISHQAVDLDDESTHNGYAVIGRINANMGGVGIRAWGGMSHGASAYTGNGLDANDVVVSNMADYIDGEVLEGYGYGAELSFGLGKATTLYALARFNQHEYADDGDVSSGQDFWEEAQYGVQISHTLAKGLTIIPAYVYTDGRAATRTGQDNGDYTNYSDSSFFLRIQRDF